MITTTRRAFLRASLLGTACALRLTALIGSSFTPQSFKQSYFTSFLGYVTLGKPKRSARGDQAETWTARYLRADGERITIKVTGLANTTEILNDGRVYNRVKGYVIHERTGQQTVVDDLWVDYCTRRNQYRIEWRELGSLS